MALNEHWFSFDVAGQRCHGMLHLPQSGAGPHPCVVLLHGFTGTHLEPHRLFALMARRFAASGIAAFRFDFRGSGDSEGDFSEATVSRELEDVSAALRLLEARPDLDRERFGLLGLSMGGLVAALSMAGEQVKALCLWAPAFPGLMLGKFAELERPELIRALFAAGFPGEDFPAGIRFDAERGVLDFSGNPVSSAFYEDMLRHDAFAAVQAHRGPSLVVHGSADPTVPLEIGERYAAALGAPLHVIEGAGHTFDSLIHQAEVHQVTLEFFQRSL